MTRQSDIEGDELPLDPGAPVLLLTMRQAAALCQVSVHRVRDWSLLPDFPVIRTPHLVRIHARLLDQWLAKHSQERGTDQEDAA